MPEFYDGQLDYIPKLNEMAEAFHAGPFDSVPKTGGTMSGPLHLQVPLSVESGGTGTDNLSDLSKDLGLPGLQSQLDILYYGSANVRDPVYAGGANNTGTVTCVAAVQAALDAKNGNIHFPPGRYLMDGGTATYTGRVNVTGNDAVIVTDGECFLFTDARGSRFGSGLRLENKTTPYTTQPNYTTWVARTVADVTQKNTGYMPTGNDTDIWADLPDSIKSQGISPTVRFTSSSSTPNKDVVIEGLTGRFACVILEGYQYSTVNMCTIQGGFGDAVHFWNGISNKFPDKSQSFGFVLARGDGNKLTNNILITPSFNGGAFVGNDNFIASGNWIQGAGESGLKQWQKEPDSYPNAYPVGAVCHNGLFTGNIILDCRYDLVDGNSTYPDGDPQQNSTLTVSDNILINGRSTGYASNSGGNVFRGNYVKDCGVFGHRSIGDDCVTQGNIFVNNVKHPGILGPYSSYDVVMSGERITYEGNTVSRASLPAYTYSVMVSGAGICQNSTSNTQIYIGPGVCSSYLDDTGAFNHNTGARLGDGGLEGNFNSLTTLNDRHTGVFKNASANPYGLLSVFVQDPNDTQHWFYRGVGGSTERFSVRSNGGIANYQSNNVNLSDEREKTDIEDAKWGYLELVRRMRIVRYRHVDQTDEGYTTGTLAGEMRAINPEWVTECNWGANGTKKMRLGNYEQDINYGAIKALQELDSIVQDEMGSLRDRVLELEAALKKLLGNDMYIKQPYFTGHGDAPPPEKPPTKPPGETAPSSVPVETDKK